MRACIFDLDGTLCETLESIAFCANQALREFGLKEADDAQYKIFVGDGIDMLIRRLLVNAGDEDCVNFDRLKKRYSELFEEGCLYKVEPCPQIPKLIDTLREKGFKLAVLSNKPHANTVSVINHVFGGDVFDIVLGQSDRFPKKPDPKAALYIAERLGVEPDECIYVGDTATDMLTGKNAGMFTVGALWGFRGKDELVKSGADITLSDAGLIAGFAVPDLRSCDFK